MALAIGAIWLCAAGLLFAEEPRPGEGVANLRTSIPGRAEAGFRDAGTAYEAGRFAEAEKIYESLLDEGFDDARIYYNLGNARFKQGRLGPATLAYERALARSPSDADTKENLTYANLLIADKVGVPEEEFPATILRVLDRTFGAERAAFALAILAVLSGLVALPLWFDPPSALRRLLRSALFVLLPAAVLSLAAIVLGVAMPGRGEYAVILSDAADGRSAPATDGTVLFTVHEGLKVEVRGERAGWIHIALPNGLAGWIEAGRAERI